MGYYQNLLGTSKGHLPQEMEGEFQQVLDLNIAADHIETLQRPVSSLDIHYIYVSSKKLGLLSNQI